MDQRGFAAPIPSSAARLAAPITLILLAACSGVLPSSSPTRIPAGSSRTPVTLSLWHTQTGGARAQLDSLVADFAKSFPWVTIRAEAKANEGDLLRQGIAAIALNQPPDLIIAGTRTIADLARRDALVALDTFVDDATLGVNAQEREDFVPGVLETGQLGEREHLYALPFDESAVVLYYNADALKSAKISGPPETWDDFEVAVRSTTRGDMRGWAMAPDAAIFYAILYSYGASVLNDAQNQVAFNGPPATQALAQIAALSKGESAYLVDSTTSARNDFAQAKAAFLLGTTDDVDVISAVQNQTGNKFSWGIANLPQANSGQPFTALLGSNTAIFRTILEREQAAWLFARWLAMPEQSARWSVASRALPVRLSALALVSQDANGLPSTLSIRLPDPLPTGRGIPAIKDAATIDQAVVEMWVAVANGTADPAAAMSRAVQRANRVLGQTP